MARSCQADLAVQAALEALVAQGPDSAPHEVGLLVGRLAVGSRDLLLALVRCPAQEGAVPITLQPAAAPRGTGGRSSKATGGGDGTAVRLDEEWVLEHAHQVARMLPGGLEVVGLYVACRQAALAPALPLLARMLGALPAARAGGALVLHADTAGRQLTLRRLPPASAAGGAGQAALRPADLTFAPVADNLQLVTCMHQVSLPFPVAAGTARLHQAVEAALAGEQARLAGAVGLLAGRPLEAGCSLADALPDAAGQAACLQLLCPPRCSTAAPASGSGASQGRVLGGACLSGAVAGRAYVHRREPATAAAALLAADVAASLRARLDLALAQAHDSMNVEGGAAAASDAKDAALQSGGPQHPLLLAPSAAAGAAEPLALPLPARAFLPTQGKLAFCDYLAPEEGVPDLVERAAELLGVRLEPAQVELPEGSAAGSRPGAGAVHGQKTRAPPARAGGGPAKRPGGCTRVAVGLGATAAAVAALAVLVQTLQLV